jgi:hypothetical protein
MIDQENSKAAEAAGLVRNSRVKEYARAPF